MNPLGTQTADWISQVRKVLAMGAANRHREMRPEQVAAYGDRGLLDVAADNEMRLDYLGEALAAECPRLFEQHAEWLKVAFSGRGLDPTFVAIGLDALRDELATALPEEASQLAVDYVGRAHAAFDAAPSESTTLLPDGAPHVDLARRYLLAVLEGNRPEAIQIALAAVDDGTTPDDVLTHVIRASQAELGRMWQIGDIHAAEEHFASRIAETLTTLLHARLTPASPNRGTVVVAAVGGNEHDLGTRVIADRFELGGWRAVLLGADSPAADVARSVIDFEADLVALSTSVALHVRSTATVIAAIRKLPERGSVPILVGGGPFLTIPDLWKSVGADGTAADAAGAIALAEDLIAARGA